ncbi:Hsp20/alpha crystallin family protein [Opitutales bacterium ASA1]|uniref:Hsp20/alpha crystallin family protein n=1 Tax=Congregicoccus parvus TaxID=3081749 RepID=UPI002B28DF31|nr:Hsp20/alpha crystallin family protein [Opitutales bacterium ASA1]
MRIVRYQYPNTLAHRRFAASPWAGFEDEINRAMDSAFSSFFGDAGLVGSAAVHPRADLFEDKDHLHFRAELPGMKREDIHVELGDGVLTLSGSRQVYGSDGKEQRKAEFSRSVSIPTRVQEDKIVARYEDGVLTVSLPKAEEVKPRKIAVQVK